MAISDYKWEITSEIQDLLSQIDILKQVFSKIPLTQKETEILFDKSIINSAVSSAQIEDIPATIDDPLLEGENLKLSYKNLYTRGTLPKLSVSEIKNFHSQVLAGVSGSAGSYRQEPWAIFNSAGVVIAQTPLHIEIPRLVEELVKFVNNLSEHPVVIASVAHFIFEKIHPFADGNGRTGRLLSAYLLHYHGYSLGGLVPLENYIRKHRSGYYQSLTPSHRITEFIFFTASALVDQANQTLEDIKNPPPPAQKNLLLPRRQEILEIIKDHPQCTFDFIRRRFINVSSQSIHRDMQFLIRAGLINKHGSTRGVVYSVC